MSQHTRGPWRVGYYHELLDETVQKTTIYTDQDGVFCDDFIATVRPNKFIASTFSVPVGAEAEANAQLIAAAPDLLGACKTFAEWLRREDEGFDHTTHDRSTPEGAAAWRIWYDRKLAICRAAQDLVVAAIAKATGEQP